MSAKNLRVRYLEHNEAPLVYSEVLRAMGGEAHLLLGNGFSIGCDPVFAYSSLFDSARAGLSERAVEVFGYMGTHNFEAVMRLLHDSMWLCEHYQIVADTSTLASELIAIKKTLVQAVSDIHPEYGKCLNLGKREQAGAFLLPFNNIFSLSYDLILYWIRMGMADLRERYKDGFDSEGDELVFRWIPEQSGVFHMHGALHLYMDKGKVKKQRKTQDRSLKDIVRESLEWGRFPLFVAEGNHESKLEQIQANPYLTGCYERLGTASSALVTYGFSFSVSDKHILERIAENPHLRQLFAGIYGELAENRNLIAALDYLVMRRAQLGQPTLDVQLYRSESAKVWPSSQSFDAHHRHRLAS